MADPIIVVGGGLAGLRTISALRRKKYAGPLLLISAEPHLPYDRPPLSKDVLRGAKDSTSLPFDPVKLEVDVRLSTTATALDPRMRTLTVRGERGEENLAYAQLVIATGAAPIRVPGDGEQTVLRTLEDAIALRERLASGIRLVIIGASWIGAEVATVALEKGCHVTCIEAGPAPLAQALGAPAAAHFRGWWAGVDLRTHTLVDRVDAGSDGRPVVHVAGGDTIAADVVLTGVGARPAIGWLEGSGLSLDRGLLVDERLRAADGVIAVGDVARRPSARFAEEIRLEHWDEAGTVGAAAAATLLGLDGAPHDPVPYFWSDQFGHKLQYVGRHRAEDTMTVEDGEDGVSSITWTDADGKLSAWLGVDRPRDVMKFSQRVGQPLGQ